MTPRGAALVAVAIAASVLVAVFATRVYVCGALGVSAVIICLMGLAVMSDPTEWNRRAPAEWRSPWSHGAKLAIVLLGLAWPGIVVAGVIMAVEMKLDAGGAGKGKEKRS